MKLKPLKLGLYQPWTADMDGGWIRWIFDTWEFPYTVIHNDDMRNGHLREHYDVIILPSIPSQQIIDGHKEGTIPSPYAGGIGSQGLAALLDFVNDGGTLVALNESAELAIKYFKVPLENVANSFPSAEFFCQSAILKADVDNTHPIAYGMEETAAVLFFDSPVFNLDSERGGSGAQEPSRPACQVIVRYPDGNPFLSGRLIGEKVLFKKPALVEVDTGKGKIIIFGFRPQNRAQTHGTFKLFFNALYYGPAMISKR